MIIGVNRVVHNNANKAIIIIIYLDNFLLRNKFTKIINVLYESIEAVLPSKPYNVSKDINPYYLMKLFKASGSCAKINPE